MKVDHRAARRALLARLLLTQARIAATASPDSDPRTRAAALRAVAGDLVAVHVVLAAELLPGPPRRLRSVAEAEAALAEAGVYDDGMIMPRCRSTADAATRAALAEDSGRPLGPLAGVTLIEAAVAHAATARDIADAVGHQEARRVAEEHHRRLLVVLDNLRPHLPKVDVPALPSDPEPIEPLPIPPLPSRPANDARA